MAFYRKGTVSKTSGPSHINSYALRSVPIKYKPPIFVPELLYLPADWKPPEMFSQDRFRYDYSLEKKVLEQARSRALSIAAEASLQRQQIEELQRKQREKEEAEALAKELAKPRPPVTFSNDILTPTPVSSCSNTSSSSGAAATASAPLLYVEAGTKQNGNTDTNARGGSIELTAEPPVIKSLGQLSIREFEGDYNNDPFEIASLQAINDMEVLQSVLQPIAPPILTSNVSSSNKMVATSSPLTQTSMMSSGNQLSDPGGTATTVTQSSPIPAPRSTTKQTSPPTVHSTLFPTSTPPSVIPPIQTAHPFPTIVPTASSTAVVGGGALSFADSFVTNTATVSAIPVVGSPGNASVMKGAPSSSEPGVGMLIDIGSHVPNKSDQPPAVDRPQGSQSSVFNSAPVDQPVPKPRTHIPAPPSGQSASSGTSVYPNNPQRSSSSPSVPSRPSPTVPPKGARVDVGEGAPPAPVVPPKGVKPERSTSPQVGFVVPSNSSTPSQGLNRLGLGVQVLPPIPQSSSHTPMPASQPPKTSVATQNVPPSSTVNKPSPPTHPKISPPPPYSSPDQRPKTHTQSPRVVPRSYKLPDPQDKLTSEQRSEVESLSGMGFPAPRVARAVLRYEGNRTKVLDFLFLVGKVEEEKYTGDSAETALIACKDDTNKAVEYLKRVEGFKNIGFQEKKIHEAHEKSDGDWDKALDRLTEDR